MNMFENLDSQITDDCLAYVLKDIKIDIIEDAFQEKDRNYNQGKKLEVKPVLVDKNLVEQVFDQVSLAAGKYCHKNHRHGGNEQFRPERANDGINSNKDIFVRHKIERIKCSQVSRRRYRFLQCSPEIQHVWLMI